ncbi:MAG: toxic anion resistance protein, partial [Anaerolineae bacterium]
NTRLGQAVERTLSLATNVITVGLAIQAALVRQEKIQEATLRTREFLGNVIVANAETIKRHTQEIGDLYNNPVIATEKLEQAHNELMQAMDIAERIKQQGIDSARANIARLGQLSADLQRRVSGLAETGEVELLSAEA